jgi:hypothetical protein
MANNPTNADLWASQGALPVPHGQRIHALTVWCDSAIWGLALYDDQTPWFTLIECLHMLTYRHREGLPLFPGLEGQPESPRHEVQSYRMKLNTNLRHLLFRDQESVRLAAQKGASHDVLWQRWLDMTRQVCPELDFSYLPGAFSNDFLQFAESLELLRSATVEQFNDKRWTSKHLQPVGEAMLFPDVKPVDGRYLLDRRFFMRTGELLYLMLNRSLFREELADLVAKRLLIVDGPWNRIARRLQGPDAVATKDEPRWIDAQTIGYLPVARLSRYDEVARDWLAILRQGAIPLEDMLEFLMRLSGLHQVIYIIERGSEVAGRGAPLPFILELSGSARNNSVQSLSSDRYRAHKALPSMAVDAFVGSYQETDEWNSLGTAPTDRTEAAQLLSKRFAWVAKRSPAGGTHPKPEEQLANMVQAAKTRNHDISSTFTSHAKKVGLLIARRRAGTWYSPSDGLLEALVLANVTSAMELGQFLALLRRRYHLVVGPEEARTASGELPVPLESLRENERRLEERLRVLGFINRKSDDCAFVVNPFAAGRSSFGSKPHAAA